MRPCNFENALTEAEIACRAAVERVGDVRVYRATNPGEPDCDVFDIGHIATGDMAAFPATCYHWRAQLDLYRRDRTALQQALMRLLAAFPVNDDNRQEDDLRENSNVLALRIAPETNAVSAVSTTAVETGKDERTVPCWTASVLFDVVFSARRDEPDGGTEREARP